MNRLKKRAFDDEEKSEASEDEQIRELRDSRIIDKASKQPRSKPLSIQLLSTKSKQAQPLLSTRAQLISKIDQSSNSLQDEALRRLMNPSAKDAIAPIHQVIAKPLPEEKRQFKQDVLSRPDGSSLEAYERIPIEAFGAAMLRGMGWNGNLDQGKVNQRGEGSLGGDTSMRPRLLGLGAEPAPVINKQLMKPGEKRFDKK